MSHTQPMSSVPKQVVKNCKKMNTRGSFLSRLRKSSDSYMPWEACSWQAPAENYAKL